MDMGSKVWISDRLFARIEGFNAARGVGVSPVRVVGCEVVVSATS